MLANALATAASDGGAAADAGTTWMRHVTGAVCGG
jgi:hypothetical protein